MADIFLDSGAVNTTIDPQTVSPIRRDAFIALQEAQLLCEQAESDQAAADKQVVEAVKEHDRAQAALPRRTFLQEWQANKNS
jgi:hypothetical protein